MSHLARHIAPFVSLLDPLFPQREKGTLSFAVKRVGEFLNSPALREMLPDSDFFTTLDEKEVPRIFSISLGGTNPRLLSLYRWQQMNAEQGEGDGGLLEPVELFSIPEILERIIPGRFFPAELQHGRGDGLVTAKSATLPWGDRHYDFNLNHAGILCDVRARDIILKAVCGECPGGE